MDFSLTPEQIRFRDEIRAWLRSNIPSEWRGRPLFGPDSPKELYGLLREWQRKVFEAGFLGLTWPKEYGGRGLSSMEELIFNEEMVLAKAPPILNLLGIYLTGPTIIAYGTETQKQRLLPRILSGEEIWCQGYSEPNAGSDLASLTTRAVREADSPNGEYYVINGQKVWTSLAHIADWIMLLARTDPVAPKHKGITYFLVEMHSPGITVRPLRQLTGDSEFNEIFFEDVRVPAANILGGVNNGWQVGLTTLMYERMALGFGLQVRLRMALDNLVALARRNRGSPVRDPILRQKLAQLWIEAEAFKYTGYRAITRLLRGELPGAEGSTGKIFWSETHQRLQALAMEIEGPYAQLTKGSRWAIEEGIWQHTFLRSLGNTIEGGTSEIQRNIVGERVLGLPKD